MKEYLLKHKISVILISISLIIYLILSFTVDSTDSIVNNSSGKANNIIDNSNNDLSSNTNSSYSNNDNENINKNIDKTPNNSSDGYLINKEDLNKMKEYRLYVQYKKSPFSINVIDNDDYINALIYPNEGGNSETEKTLENDKTKDTKNNTEDNKTNTQSMKKEGN